MDAEDAPATERPASDFRALGPVTPRAVHGQRLDRWLAQQFPFRSRGAWKTACQQRELLVDGRPVRAHYRLRGGEQLAVYHPLSAEPQAELGIELLGEMHGILAIFKPGNLPMHESGEFRRHTFAALLAAQFGPEWHPVHRLDRETSGVLLCAGTAALRRSLSELFARQQVSKRYLAVVSGVVAWDDAILAGPIAPDPAATRPRYMIAPWGLPARSDCTVLERAAAATLLQVRPRTGRTNQIRVHLAAAGHPLLGDKIYHRDPRVYAAYHQQGDSAAVRALAGFPRQALHAASISLRHPETCRELAVASPLPTDLAALWRRERAAPHGATTGKVD